MRGVGVYTKELIAALKKNNNLSIHEFFHIGEIPKDIDLVHFTNFDPFFLTLPWVMNKPFVVTVHDLIPLVFPKHFVRGVRGEIKWQIQKWHVSHATQIITDSQCSKNDAVKILHKPQDDIDVVLLAPRSIFKAKVSALSLKSVVTKYVLPKRFAVYVGDVNWNKNIFGLLTAWHILSINGALQSGEKLYLVGSAFLGQSQEAHMIERRIREFDLSSSVVRVGRVSDDELPSFLSLSTMCVLPSFYEGFGLPVVEAMTAGTIVVTTHGGSLSEIAGPSLICDPYVSDSIAKKINEAFSLSQTKREELIRAGHAWADKFTWERVADETVAVYNRALPH